MSTANEELRILLNSDVPSQISKLEESSVQLERAASYCELFYNQANNKEEAFNATKKLTLQSLASVAYYINSLSTALLRSLDFGAENLAEKISEARNIDKIVAIQREKSARREIGKLTISRNIIRQNKITYPAVEEKAPRYQRTPIDYSLLDGIGHGRQSTVAQQNEYSTTLNRTGSMDSNDYGTYGGIYDYGRRGTQTLTRNSVRSVADNQYRIPQLIPSAISLENAVQQQQQIYHQLQHQQQMNQQPLYMRMNSHENGNSNSNNHYHNSTHTLNYQKLNREMGELSYADGTDDTMNRMISARNGGADMIADGSSINTGHAGNYAVSRIRQPPPQTISQNFSGQHFPGNYSNTQYRLSNDSIGDGLPPPPSATSSMPNPDDPLPPPPAIFDNSANNDGMVPTNYIEKARVVYGYDANRADELTLIEDSIVYILHKNEDGWYEGVMNGITGLFPGNYVVPF